jgi:hypothetical protein
VHGYSVLKKDWKYYFRVKKRALGRHSDRLTDGGVIHGYMDDWSYTGHKWLGARVAWRFGAKMESGQCTAWIKYGHRSLWRVNWDDGDVEDFTLMHMREGLLYHRQLQQKVESPRIKIDNATTVQQTERCKPTRRATNATTVQQTERCKPTGRATNATTVQQTERCKPTRRATNATTVQQTEQCKPTRRATGVVGTAAPRCPRRVIDPLQSFVTFPILISPSYLTASPSESAAISPWWQLDEMRSCETSLKRPLVESNRDRQHTPPRKKRIRAARP